MKLHIALIGLSGTGKSTVARLLAERLGCAAADTDARIVADAGRPIAAIFAAEGEAHFRDLESAALAAALGGPPAVIATGGGIVLRETNRALLRARARVAWLDAPTATIVARLQAHAEQRPLLAGDDPAARIEALRAAREPLYRALADLRIDVDALEPGQVAERLAAYLKDSVKREA